MSNDINSAIVQGRLTRDLEIRYSPNGAAIGSFAIAVNKTFVKDGEKKESVSYFDCVIFGKGAETAAQYIGKGDSVIIDGSFEQRRWEKDGEKKSKIELVVKPFGLHFGPKRNGGNPSAGDEPMPDSTVEDINSGDIPF